MHTWRHLAPAVGVLGGGLLVVCAGIASARLFGRCRHKKMSWPVRRDGCTYQVCLNCGIKRLFDEEQFRAFGRYSHDLDQLTAKPT